VLRLTAYVHQSEGRPDQDRGTGWTQEADLRVGMATLIEAPTTSLWILDGAIGDVRAVYGTYYTGPVRPMLPPDKLKHFVDYVPEALAADDARRILDVNAARLLGLAEDM